MPHVSVARHALGPEGWRFVERGSMRLAVLEGSSRSVFTDRNAGPPWVRLSRREHSIRLPLDQAVRVVEGRGERTAAGTYRFSWSGSALRQFRDRTDRVVRRLVPVELVVPVDRDGGRIARTVLWVMPTAERLEIELDALKRALPCAFSSGAQADGPNVDQVHRLLLGAGTSALRFPARAVGGGVPGPSVA